MFKISVTPEEIEKLTMASFPGEIVVIDRFGTKSIRALKYLSEQKVLGFDTESRPSFSPDQPHYGVSLLQLSSGDKAFLFRVKKFGMPRALKKILSSDKIIKVGAAVADDVRGLRKLSGFEPGGFVDLQKIVWEYGIRDKSVKKIASHGLIAPVPGINQSP